MIELALIGASVGLLTASLFNRYERALEVTCHLARAGQWGHARLLLKNALLFPALGRSLNGWALCMNLLAYVEGRLGRSEEASRLVDRVLDRKGLARSVRGLILFRIAEARQWAGFESEAAAYRRQAEELFRNSEEELTGLWLSVGLLLYGTGEHRLASDCFERAVETRRDSTLMFLRWLCLAASGEDQSDRIWRAAQEALEVVTYPEQRVCLLLSSARCEREFGRLEEAVAQARECAALVRNPGFFQFSSSRIVPVGLVQLQRSLGMEKEAEETRARVFSRLNPARPEELSRMLALLHDEGNILECLDLLEAAPESSRLCYARGITYYEGGYPETALSHLQAALRIADQTQFRPPPHLLAYYCELSCFRPQQARYHLDALEEWDESCFHRERATLAYIWEGDPETGSRHAGDRHTFRLLYEGRFEDAVASLEETRPSYDMTASPLYFRRGVQDYHRASLWIYQGRWEEALHTFHECHRVFERHPVRAKLCLLWAALCRARMGEDVRLELLNFRKQLVTAYPDHPLLLAQWAQAMAEVLHALAMHNEAIDFVEKNQAAEVRAFSRARLLDWRRRSYLALDKREEAGRDAATISSLVPGSYLGPV